MSIQTPAYRKFFGFFIFTLTLLISSCASHKFNRNIKSELNNASNFKQGFSGLAVYDPEKKEMLFEYNSDKYFTPASNTKLFTYYTGLTILGDSVPALKYTIRQDSLIFKGTGDPSFLNPDLPESKVFQFLKNSDKKLFYYLPTYTEKYFGPGWAWDDFDSYYSAERVAFPIYGNLIKATFAENSNIPEIQPAIMADSISPIPEKIDRNKYIQRDWSSNKMEYQDFGRDKKFEQSIPFKFSPQILAELLSDTLQKKVKIYHGNVEQLNFDRTLYSIPADSMYRQMLQVSDNFIAEQILLMAADKLSDSLKTTIAIDYMKKNELKDLPDEPIWKDGSGLSRYNLFTPRTMVKLLEKISKIEPREELFKMLPAGGQSGTLQNYYKANKPYIYAKTGSLSNNHSLSGFLITRSGRVLIFSFMNSNYTVPTSELKKGMTDVLEKIRDHY